MTARYAIYYAPPTNTRLWAFGCRVLGRDAETGESPPLLVPQGFDESRWRAITEAPRRYGFHATLKAPFALTAGRTEEHLREALQTFTITRARFPMPKLVVRRIGGFVALVPDTLSPDLDDLAGAVVEAFDPFRAPLAPGDRARRLAAPLTERQQGHLDRWGYPYVFEDFRFHMTLTGALGEAEADQACAGLVRLHQQETGESLMTDGLALFADPGGGSPFRLVARFLFGR